MLGFRGCASSANGWAKRLELLWIKARMFRQLLKRGFEDFEVQPVLAFEMIINGRLVDASFDDDVPHARALEALFREQTDGGLDNGAARIFSRTGHWSPIQTTV